MSTFVNQLRKNREKLDNESIEVIRSLIPNLTMITDDI